MIKSKCSKRQYRFLFFILGLAMVIGFVIGGLTSAFASTPGTWEITGSMNHSRMYHTATLLPNGKVLVAGGVYGAYGDVTNTAELYDPATKTFNPTGNMNHFRYRHTATLLPNGKVLIGGGPFIDSFELYDPANGSFSVIGYAYNSSQTATLLHKGQVLLLGQWNAYLYDPATGNIRTTAGQPWDLGDGFTATLLPNGKVLIAGGRYTDNSGLQDSKKTAQLYDPDTETFSPITGKMTYGRARHTATLLPNGKVLIAGGCRFYDCSELDSAEIYDPAAETFSLTGSMAYGRDEHTATLLTGGKVLVVGTYLLSRSVEVYNTDGGYFVGTGLMQHSRTGHTATLLPDGKVLVTGGRDDVAPSGTTNSAEIYCPHYDGDIFGPTASMGTARGNHTATLLTNGKVLVAGGYNLTNGNLASAELHDPVTDSFSPTGLMATARQGHTATLLNDGKTLIAGGYSNIASAELYDTPTGKFIATGSMGTGRYLHTATFLTNGKVLITGGQNSGGYLASAELYDPVTGTFSPTGSMASARKGHTATLLNDGTVLITGGRNSGGYLASAELYDPTSGTFSNTAIPMVYAREGHTATLLNSGFVLIAGGKNSGGYLDSTELYAPSLKAFIFHVPMGIASGWHTATLMQNGKVLIAGGNNKWGALNSDRIYDPNTGFIFTLPMTIPRYNHTATLLPNGRVLVTGGFNLIGDYLASAEMYQTASCGKPDLVVMSITTNPVSPAPGQNVEITVTVKNQGDKSPINNFYIEIYKNRTTRPLPYDDGDVWCYMPYNLAAGATTTCTQTVSYALVGTYNLWSQVDSYQSTDESNEDNNVYGPRNITIGIPFYFTLIVTKAGTGSGTVTSNPSGINCGADCTENYNSGTSVTLTATADSVSNFTGWSGDPDCSDGVVTMNTAKTCTATFTLNPIQYTLTVTKSGNGSGTVTSNPSGINCGADCTENYNSGTVVTLTAAPSAGSTFTSWSGDPDCSDGVVTMSAAKTCTATFTLNTTTDADLLVSAWTAQDNACGGAQISIQDTTKNQGTGSAGASQTCFYFSVNTTIDGGDTKLGCRDIPGLAPGIASPSTGKATTNVTLPNVPTGKYNLIAMADDGKIVAETNETNNKKTQPIYIGPDLDVTSIVPSPLKPVAGQNVSITVTVKNIGCSAAGAFRVDFYKNLSTAPAVNQAGDNNCSKASLAAGASTTCTFNASYSPAGTYKMWAQADTMQQVTEGNETNNKMSKSITVNP